MNGAEYVQGMRDLMVQYQEGEILLHERWAEQADSEGRPDRAKEHRALAAKLRTLPYPWDRNSSCADQGTP